MVVVRKVVALTFAIHLSRATNAAALDGPPLAESLFQNGVAAMERGDFHTACGMLAESQRLDPGGGTLLNLALCNERAGRVASAWAYFHDALSVARRDGRDDRIHFAEAHIESLEPRLARVDFALSDPVLDVHVTFDNIDIPVAALTAGSMPVDAGEHLIRVQKRGYRPREAHLSIVDGNHKIVRIAALEPLALPVPHNGKRTVGWSLTGVGATALLATGVVGALALGAESAASVACPNSGVCDDATALSASRRASSLSTVATVTGITGIVTLAVGVVLLTVAR